MRTSRCEPLEVNPMKAIILGALPLTFALSFASSIAPASAQRVCDVIVGGVRVNCRTDDRYYSNRKGNDGYYANDRHYDNPGKGWRWRDRDRYDNGRYNDRFYGPGPERVGGIINSFYRQYLGRDADPRGLRDYLRAYQNGSSLEQIRWDIANSDEGLRYQRRYGNRFDRW
jgi:hypothetical protein